METLLTIQQVKELGWSEATIWRESRAGRLDYVKGKRVGRYGKAPKLIKLSSLPIEMQLEWARRNQSAQAAAAPDEKPVEEGEASSAVPSDDAIPNNNRGGLLSTG